MKIIQKILKKVLQKCWREMKSVYLCTRKTRGTVLRDDEGVLRKFFERMIQAKSER